MDKTEISYHPTEFEANLAHNNCYQRFGDAVEFVLVSPPNHDRTSWKVECTYDESRVRRSFRRYDPRTAVM